MPERHPGYDCFLDVGGVCHHCDIEERARRETAREYEEMLSTYRAEIDRLAQVIFKSEQGRETAREYNAKLKKIIDDHANGEPPNSWIDQLLYDAFSLDETHDLAAQVEAMGQDSLLPEDGDG